MALDWTSTEARYGAAMERPEGASETRCLHPSETSRAAATDEQQGMREQVTRDRKPVGPTGLVGPDAGGADRGYLSQYPPSTRRTAPVM